VSWEEDRDYGLFREAEMQAYRLALKVTPPWDHRAVLVGPFDPCVEHVHWYGSRKERHWRRPEVKVYPALVHVHTLINSVPVPVRQLRSLLQTLRLTALDSTASPVGQLAWQQAFAADAAGWHAVDLLANSALPLAIKLHAQATQRIQALRTRAYSNGGWWPAPQSITLAYHPDHFELRASMAFVAHYMEKSRTTLTLPLPAQPLAAPP
jgi:hypothetical protein